MLALADMFEFSLADGLQPLNKKANAAIAISPVNLIFIETLRLVERRSPENIRAHQNMPATLESSLGVLSFWGGFEEYLAAEIREDRQQLER